MKVILRQDVSNLGKFGDVVKVAAGYARNYLIPKRLALPSNDSAVKQLNAEKDAHLRKEQSVFDKAERLKTGIEAVTLSFVRKAGDDERLFGSVTSHDIDEALKEKGFALDKKDIHLEEPLKRLGLHTVPVKLHSRVSAGIKLEIVKE
ncbi:MAG: 50S ribosomal protein L9 [Deltaproteobacteria bacterium]|nr:50S ribosomal protein L9 [Deltaproteobacteria bacterium]